MKLAYVNTNRLCFLKFRASLIIPFSSASLHQFFINNQIELFKVISVIDENSNVFFLSSRIFQSRFLYNGFSNKDFFNGILLCINK